MERRKHERLRILKRGKVVQRRGALTFDCTIRDMSPHGAWIALAPGQALDDAFELIEVKSGRAFDATVVWRDEASARLRFAGEADLSQAGAAPHKAHLRRLWLDYAPR
ncbi:MAG TPA: PilZ domain-containing protein [Caulobacteraceae bacterium]|nr:PilZ domain-containing protein [Caulobacteraceae bacterium]